METTDDISIGQVVISKRGRDSGRNFIVLNKLDSEYVLICDGDLRKLDKPKKKKIKHLRVTNTVLEELKNKIIKSEKINNSYIRKQLATVTNII
ncbi:KOW domain-containing RNA-binding protein [Clostridiaceae bacterium M8S5]|nr:KOW domain-containing RNA-binding protein [Clostridiaceae bacterium M8S5]